MGIGDLVQKAVYLGIGVASYAGEKASETLGDLQGQIDKLGGLQEQLQKLADEMVSRGEMTAEDGRRFVDDMVKKAQETPGQPSTDTPPRKIEIVDEPAAGPTAATAAEPTAPAQPSGNSNVDDIDVDTMRRQVMELQEELRRLRRS
jgi:polyhydroxyalkanoate synthesis regulator phasin